MICDLCHEREALPHLLRYKDRLSIVLCQPCADQFVEERILCDRCHERQAHIHYHHIEGDKMTLAHYCEPCGRDVEMERWRDGYYVSEDPT